MIVTTLSFNKVIGWRCHLFTTRHRMRARLFLLALVASFGYFTFGLAVAWPAAALPSIRFLRVYKIKELHLICRFYVSVSLHQHKKTVSLTAHNRYFLSSMITIPPHSASLNITIEEESWIGSSPRSSACLYHNSQQLYNLYRHHPLHDHQPSWIK